MQQRASLCRALIHEPSLLMLDEPFAALDTFTREELWCVIRDLHASRKITVCLVTRALREAAFRADRIFVMSARPARVLVRRRVGFGVLLGLAVGWSRSIYAGLYPLMIGFNAIPKVAVVPILVLWFGIGFVPAVLTAFLISFFPIVVNVATGLATIEPELEDVLKALGASKLDIMRKVGIPRALPYFFGSLKVAITLAFVGSVISESVASNTGIGNLMLQAQAQFQVPLIFAGLVALAVEGIVMYWALALLEAPMTGLAEPSGVWRT